MDLTLLRAFATVAREGNLTRAAAQLHLTQPAVSLQIKHLQETLGVTLFTRTSRGLALTRDGQTLLPHAERALAAAADVQRTLRWRIQVSNFETACRMIEANVGVGVLPEGTARRHAKTMALRLVALEDGWAERQLQICVADLDALPRFARDLVDLLVADARDQPD